MIKPRTSEFANYKQHSTLISQRTDLPFELGGIDGETIPIGTPIIKTRLSPDVQDVSIRSLLLDIPSIVAAHALDSQSSDPPQYVVGITERPCAVKIASRVDIHFTPITELDVPAYMAAEAILGHAHRHEKGQIGSLVVAHMTTDEFVRYACPAGL